MYMSDALAEGELQTVNLPCDSTICASSSVPFPRAVAAKRADPRSRGAPHSNRSFLLSQLHTDYHRDLGTTSSSVYYTTRSLESSVSYQFGALGPGPKWGGTD